MKPIFIKAIQSISALGINLDEVWQSYQSKQALFVKNHSNDWVCALNEKQEDVIENLSNQNLKKHKLDRTVLMTLALGQSLISLAGWQKNKKIGVNIGSSRGATHVFEQDYAYFLKTGQAKTHTSPTTTLGNISSWLAQDLGLAGPEISHSITCSSGLHALLNGVAWLNAGLTKRFIVGAAESPLTPFTIAQMKALKIYSNLADELPCQSMLFEKKTNSMILSEGAILLGLSKKKDKNDLGKIIGIGYGIESLNSPTAISKNGVSIQLAMQMALKNHDLKSIDAVVMHAPGTIQGDLSELNGIQAVFKNDLPYLTSNKWQIGHTFGASGLFSLELALLMLKHQHLIENPFYKNETSKKTINRILVNGVGFGGNAVSVLVER